jgi:hypothetical protein
VTGLLARTFFKVDGDLRPPELIEAAGGAPEISRCVNAKLDIILRRTHLETEQAGFVTAEKTGG